LVKNGVRLFSSAAVNFSLMDQNNPRDIDWQFYSFLL